MASSSAPAAGPQGNGKDQVIELKAKLYERCAMEDTDTVFGQEDLLAMSIIPGDDMRLLLQVTQRLCDEKLFKIVREGTSISWMYRPASEAAKYRSLSREQEMVYSLIDEAGRDGIWIRRIKDRCGLHDSTTRAALKFLETKKYITDMKSVEHLNQKMYIKATMAPSEKATGGPWYTDGELDDAFIDIIEAVLYRRIFELSYRKSAAKDTLRKAKKSIGGGERRSSVSKPTSEEARAARDAALNPKIKIEEESSRPSKRRKEATHAERFLHYPADYREYPTLQELTLYVENSSYTTTVLSAEEISQLLDVLCYDKKIEKIRVPGSDKEAYKAVDRSAPYIETDPYKGPSNGLTGVPCGRCPVFDLCEEGGPVAPSNCEYFREWFQN